jgi:hypothetical protein
VFNALLVASVDLADGRRGSACVCIRRTGSALLTRIGASYCASALAKSVDAKTRPSREQRVMEWVRLYDTMLALWPIEQASSTSQKKLNVIMKCYTLLLGET